MIALPSLIFRLNVILLKFSTSFFFFMEFDKLILKCIWDSQDIWLDRLENLYYLITRLLVKLQLLDSAVSTLRLKNTPE